VVPGMEIADPETEVKAAYPGEACGVATWIDREGIGADEDFA
jgi:hypothetical protein